MHCSVRNDEFEMQRSALEPVSTFVHSYRFQIVFRADDIFCVAYRGTRIVGIGRLSPINPDCLFVEKIRVRSPDRGISPVAMWLLERLVDAGRTTNKAIHGAPLRHLSRRSVQ